MMELMSPERVTDSPNRRISRERSDIVTHNLAAHLNRGRDCADHLKSLARHPVHAALCDDPLCKIHQPAALAVYRHATRGCFSYALPDALVRFEFPCKEFGIAAAYVDAVHVREFSVMKRTEIDDICAMQPQKIDVIRIIEIKRLIKSNTDPDLRPAAGITSSKD